MNPADNLATHKVTRLSRIRTTLNNNAVVIIQLLVFVMFIVLVTNLWIKTLDVNDRINALAEYIIQQDEHTVQLGNHTAQLSNHVNQQDERIDKLSSVLDNNARILLHRDEVLADRIKELQSKERIGYQIACND